MCGVVGVFFGVWMVLSRMIGVRKVVSVLVGGVLVRVCRLWVGGGVGGGGEGGGRGGGRGVGRYLEMKLIKFYSIDHRPQVG